MTAREKILLSLCMSGTENRATAIAACRVAFSRHYVTLPSERANVAAYLTSRGYDGIGRVQLAADEMTAAAANAE